MNAISRPATFRGAIGSHVVNQTKNGFPRWVAELKGTEIWDDEDKVWVDWTSDECVQEGDSIMAYLCLFGGKGETLTCTQVKKITGWDGLSFQGLNDLDLSETGIQFRVEWNSYDGKDTLQVAWVDEYDATPGNAIKKLNANEMKALNARFKAQMTKAAPATAPAKGKPVSPGKVNAKSVKPTQKKGPVKKAPKATPAELAKTTPEAPPAAPPIPTADDATDLPDLRENKRSKKAAWENVNEVRLEHVTEKMQADAWLAAIIEVSGGNDPDALSEEQWYQVEVIVLEVVQSKI